MYNFDKVENKEEYLSHILFHEFLHVLMDQTDTNELIPPQYQEEGIVENMTNNIIGNNIRAYSYERLKQSYIELLLETNRINKEDYYKAFIEEEYNLMYEYLGAKTPYDIEILRHSIKTLFKEKANLPKSEKERLSIYNISLLGLKNLNHNITKFSYEEYIQYMDRLNNIFVFFGYVNEGLDEGLFFKKFQIYDKYLENNISKLAKLHNKTIYEVKEDMYEYKHRVVSNDEIEKFNNSIHEKEYYFMVKEIRENRKVLKK